MLLSKLRALALACLLALLPSLALADAPWWIDLPASAGPGAQRPGAAPPRAMRLDLPGLRGYLATAPAEHSAEPGRVVVLPMPDGTTASFRIREASVMAPELAAKFPEIRTWAGRGVEDPSATVRLDVTPHGFHAVVFRADATIYIDPESAFHLGVGKSGAAKSDQYRVYFKRDAGRDGGAPPWQCLAEEEKQRNPPENRPVLSRPAGPGATTSGISGQAASLAASGTQLRDYRLAVAATGEYTTYFGGTVPLGMAAIVTAVNRVVGIYEREVAVTMTLVANNDLVVYTNGATDPYTNNSGSTMLSQNQTNLDSVIGSANYDVGHVFSTGGGGIASLGVPCVSGQKARGVTGSSAPTGDAFWVDYVAHEMGHQFDANHTFNGTTGSCSGNRNASTAYEPGSGTTIMAYAGICSPQDIQPHSDDHFHSASFDEIVAYTTAGNGNACPTITATGNDPPVVNAGTGGFTIPVDTPFTLSGSASDPNLDPLVYRWEELDLGPAGAPDSPSGNAPLFRSFSAVSQPSRTFPQWSDILNNTHTLGELLPSYTRSLSFRLTALDNLAGGGGVDYDSVSFDVTDTAGPFVVTAPNTAITLNGLDVLNVTWNVANTTAAPVSCANVDIHFSDDGGASFSALLSATPNDGAENVTVPNVDTSAARIQVACSDNVFFDVGDADFTVNALTTPDFTLDATPEPLPLCAGGEANASVDLGSLVGFSDPVTLSVTGLPSPAVAQFSQNPATPPASVTATVTNTTGVAGGTYPIAVQGTSGMLVHSDPLDLVVTAGLPAMPSVVTPAIGASGVSLTPTLQWTAVAGAASYSVELATDAAFASVVESASGPATSFAVAGPLAPATGYFWRVLAQNGCGSAFQMNGSFTTLTTSSTCATPSAAIPDGTAVPVTSTIVISQSGTLADVNVPLQVSHTWIGDLTASVERVASATSVALLDRPGLPAIDPDFGCGNDDIDAVLDDEGGSAAEDACAGTPPAMSGNLTPTGSLAGFDGLDSASSWTLSIADHVSLDSGTLDAWCLDFTYALDLSDGDSDGVANLIDNCPGDANADQADQDGDGLGAPCDPDIDGDGMPNDWETGYALDPYDPADAGLDPDGDGLTNLEEYQGGTNPNVSNAPLVPTLPVWGLPLLAALLLAAGRGRRGPRRGPC